MKVLQGGVAHQASPGTFNARPPARTLKLVQHAKPSASEDAKIGIHLDLEALRKSYQETCLNLPPANQSPMLTTINVRLMEEIQSSTNITQLSKLVQTERASMSSKTMATAMYLASYNLNKKNAGNYKSKLPAGHSNSDAYTASISSPSPVQQDNRTASASGWRPHSKATKKLRQDDHTAAITTARTIVRTLLIEMSSAAASNRCPVDVAQVTTALLCTGRTWGHVVLPADMSAAVQALMAHIQPHLFVCNEKELARLAQGIGYMNVQVDQSWMAMFSRVSQSKMFSMTGNQISLVSWCLARRDHSPGHFWLSCLESYSLPLLQSMDAVAISNLIWAVAKWRYSPGDEWSQAAGQALTRNVLQLSAPGLASVMYSIRKLYSRPPSGLVNACYDRLQQVCQELTPAGDCQVLAAMSKFSSLPDEEDFENYIATVLPRLRSYSAGELSSIVFVLGNMKYLPSQAWLSEWESCMIQNMRQATADEAAKALEGLSILRVQISWQLLSDMTAVIAPRLQDRTLPVRTAARLLKSFSELRATLPYHLLQDLLMLIATEPVSNRANDESASRPSFPADVGARKVQTTAAHATAKAVGDAVVALPYMLAQYARQQHSSNPVVVVNTNVAEGHATPHADSPAAVQHVQLSNGGAVSLPGPADQGHGNQSPLADIPVQDVDASSARRYETADATETSSRHPSADLVPTMLPPSLAVPFFSAVQARLHLMSSKQLIRVLRSLMLLRLSPGLSFLQSHVRALAPHVVAMSQDDKFQVDSMYKLLRNGPDVLQLEPASKQGYRQQGPGILSSRANRSS